MGGMSQQPDSRVSRYLLIPLMAVAMAASGACTSKKHTAVSPSASLTPTPPVSVSPSTDGTPTPSALEHANCNAIAGGDSGALSSSAFTARLVGRWKLCSEKGIGATADAGIEFTADHHWYKLRGNDVATATREVDAKSGGTLNATDRSS